MNSILIIIIKVKTIPTKNGTIYDISLRDIFYFSILVSENA